MPSSDLLTVNRSPDGVSLENTNKTRRNSNPFYNDYTLSASVAQILASNCRSVLPYTREGERKTLVRLRKVCFQRRLRERGVLQCFG